MLLELLKKIMEFMMLGTKEYYYQKVIGLFFQVQEI